MYSNCIMPKVCFFAPPEIEKNKTHSHVHTNYYKLYWKIKSNKTLIDTIDSMSLWFLFWPIYLYTLLTKWNCFILLLILNKIFKLIAFLILSFNFAPPELKFRLHHWYEQCYGDNFLQSVSELARVASFHWITSLSHDLLLFFH